MLEGHDDHPGKAGCGPAMIKLHPGDAAFARRWGVWAIFRGESQRRLHAEVPLLIEHRIVRIGMSIIAFGQQHGCANINGLSPELREQLALDPDVLHIGSVAGWERRRNFVIECKADLVASERIKMKVANFTVKISR